MLRKIQLLVSLALPKSCGVKSVAADVALLLRWMFATSAKRELMINSPSAYSSLTPGLRRNDVAIAYTFLRIIFGVNFFNHGFTRIGDIGGFANSMVELFKNSPIPAELVRINGILIPPVELAIGVLLLLGLFTRGALVAGFVLMLILQVGVVILQNWDTVASQLIYCIIFFLLLATLGFNTFSLDCVRKRSSS